MVNNSLYVDFGNTATKYLHKDHLGYFENSRQFIEFIETNGVNTIFLSSVTPRSGEYKEIAEARSINVVAARVVNNFCGLSMSYTDVTAFGVDRWLSLISARKAFPNTDLCLVSVGTAITVDCLDQNGSHLGGAIAPGLKLSSNALHASTGKLPEVDLLFNGALGTDTESSINFGIIMGAAGLVEHAVIKMKKQQVELVLTGGDADLLKPWLSKESSSLPNSVLKGLVTYSAIYDQVQF